MTILGCFTVPFGEYQMEAAKAVPLCDKLKKIFFEKESLGSTFKNKTYRSTQKGNIFESTFDIFNWHDPAIDELSDHIRTHLKLFLGSITTLNPLQINSLKFNFHPWYHITRNGGRQGMHNHSNSSWSGIFCIDPGEKIESMPDSGVVYFHDPRANANMYEDDGLKHLKGEFAHGVMRIEHVAGRLLFFPSYLYHEIFPYFGKTERVVVAFNCRITLPENS